MKNTASTMRGRVAVLIATCDRPDLLARRALRSVFSQSRAPDRVVIVDDSIDDKNSKLTRRYIRRFYPKVEILANRRTKGLSGALNSGIDHLARFEKSYSDVFVAILDDDDRWYVDHLEQCIANANRHDSNMVASGLIRKTNEFGAEHKHSISDKLDPEELFVSGQHIQGSNLFLTLALLLQSGMFDEHMPSCTDRDLCIRLSRLSSLRFSSTTKHTVVHYADKRPDRLSTPNSTTKQLGLERFWRKHASSFNPKIQKIAMERAKALFGWEPKKREVPTSKRPRLPVNDEKLSLIVGFITDSNPAEHVQGLMNDLVILSQNQQIQDLKVFVLENGPRAKGTPSQLERIISSFRMEALDIRLCSLEQQESDWMSIKLPDSPNPYGSRRPIAVTRTLLNTYLLGIAHENEGAAIWILDDDKRLKVRVQKGEQVEYLDSPNISGLIELKKNGIDVVIGPDTDAAPLPFLTTLRVQLLDLENFVQSFSPDGEIMAVNFGQGVGLEIGMKDSHYDLSRVTEHLETPLPIDLNGLSDNPKELIHAIAEKVERMLAGEPLFRPLAVAPEDFDITRLRDSVQRGGSTIFFDANALAVFPHTISRIGDQYIRRSDMITALLMRDLLGMKIVMHPFAGVSHDRTHTKPQDLRDETLRQDVLGYALYRTVEEILKDRQGQKRGNRLLAFSDDELETGRHLINKYMEERLAALRLNVYRICGLCDAISVQIEKLLVSKVFLENEAIRSNLATIKTKVNAIEAEFDVEIAKQFISEIQESLTDAEAIDSLRSMDGIISEYQQVTGASDLDSQMIVDEREANARKLILKELNVSELSILGYGGEGIVFTDETLVFKVFDLLKHRPGHDTYAILSEYKVKLNNPKFTYCIHDLRVVDGTIILTYPYEESTPYTGGHGADLLGMLRELKEAGFVFRNMHPDNLRVTENGLKLIDIGSDLRPYSEAAYRSMAERAWLSWMWSNRDDLRMLMRTALNDKSIPELEGFNRFWEALAETSPSATKAVNEVVLSVLQGRAPDSLLDYGCGKKAWTIRSLSPSGIRCVGYDADENLVKRWTDINPDKALLTTDRKRALGAGPYDAVVSSLVLCEIEDGSESEQVLSDIRAAMVKDGVAIITICNPFSTFGQPTPLHKARILPAGVTYSDCFWYEEYGESGRPRNEFHRPIHQIEKDLLRHGLVIEQIIESKTVDIERFEPASDFMTLVCRASDIPANTPRVSLLIKSCGMEATTIERQVKHLVSQLEGPHSFCERVLLLDSLKDHFTRQYAKSDLDELKRAADRLLRFGFIDRIIEGPADPNSVSGILHIWFGLESTATHTAQGAPLAAPLNAFEECSGEYILQVDSDLLIHRSESKRNYLDEMICAVRRDPRAITASLSVAQYVASNFSTRDDDQPWRVEVRGCLLHRERLLNARPFYNRIEDGRPSHSWHRSIDESAKLSCVHSLRGRCEHTWFVHPENEVKYCVREWMLMLDLVEKGHVSADQYSNVNLVGGPISWVPRSRKEPYIFLVTGRNVPRERMVRCLDSILKQEGTNWGAIIIDDASDILFAESLKLLVRPHFDKITLIQPRERMGQLANMTLAIRHVCTNPDSVIVTLDLDDCLIGTEVLNLLEKHYSDGSDVTVGSMLRTDKHIEYQVDLTDPRKSRGGNVWQHLRSFKKRLFDRIPDHFFRINDSYVDIAVDWSYMLPIVEMAEKPVWIREQLYLYEPSGMGKGSDRSIREDQIFQIISKPNARVMALHTRKPLLEAKEITEEIWRDDGGILFLRHAERPSFKGLADHEKHVIGLTEEGIQQSRRLGAVLEGYTELASSPIKRAVQTAESILTGANNGHSQIRITDSLARFRCSDDQTYKATKKRLGWNELMISWMDGSLRPGLLHSCYDVSAHSIQELTADWTTSGNRVVAITHDFIIMALLATLKGLQTTKIPYLAGVYISYSEIEHWIEKDTPHER